MASWIISELRLSMYTPNHIPGHPSFGYHQTTTISLLQAPLQDVTPTFSGILFSSLLCGTLWVFFFFLPKS